MRRSTSGFIFLLLLTSVFLLPVTGNSQTINGSISGVVKDQTGAAIAGAVVKVTNVGTGATREATTNGEGLYRVAGLPIGTYSVRAEKGGFQANLIERVDVNVAVDSSANFTLGTAALQEVVTVTDTTALLETTQSQVTKTVDSRQILELPGRNNLNGLALLNPGVLPNQNGRPGSGFAVNGNRTRSNNFTIDGANNNDQSLSIPRQNLPPEAIGEFQLITNNFASEFGRNAGSYVNVITRSGTNEFHGIAHYTWLGNGWDALSTGEQRIYNAQRAAGRSDRQALRAARTVEVDNTYGGTLGGPIKKDHTFFFTSLDFQDERETAGSVTRVALTQQGIDALRANSSQFAPGALDFLLNTFPVANDPTPQGSVNVVTPTGTINVPFQTFNRTINGGIPYGTDFWRYLAKINTKINSKDQLSFRYIIDDFKDPGSPASLIGQEIGQVTRNQSFTINDVYTITSNLINEARLTYSRRNINFPENLPTAFSISGVGGAFNSGNGNFPQFRIDNSYELTDNVSYIRSNHNLKFGVNALRYDLNSFFAPALDGQIVYTSLSNFLFDRNANILQFAGEGYVPARTYEIGMFGQDDWRVNQNLTLNLGLRYEYVTTPFGFFSNAKSDLNNFGPSIGFAWNPKQIKDGRFVLRGGYRTSYDQVFQNVLLNVSRNFPRAVQFARTITGAAPYNGLPPVPQPQDFVTLGGDPNLLPLRLYSPNKRIDQPMSQQFTLGVQYQLANDYVVKVDYIGTKGTHLVREVEANLGFLPPIGNGLRADPTKGSILIGDGIANSIYHSGQITFEKRFGGTKIGSLQYNVNYTYSSFISEADDVLGGQTNRTLPADPRNARLDRARSGFDQPHRFVASYTYAPPALVKGGNSLASSVVNRVVNGWELSGITTFATGTPYSVLNANNALGILPGQVNTVQLSQRATFNPNGTFPVVSGTDLQGVPTNPNAMFFANAENSGIGGTLGANTQRTGGINSTDLAVVKDVKTVGETQKLQIRWEVFNVFNRRNFTTIPANVASNDTNLDLFLNLGRANLIPGRSMLFTFRYFF
jgi:outer membrane receptor protein involved in Fe transport